MKEPFNLPLMFSHAFPEQAIRGPYQIRLWPLIENPEEGGGFGTSVIQEYPESGIRRQQDYHFQWRILIVASEILVVSAVRIDSKLLNMSRFRSRFLRPLNQLKKIPGMGLYNQASRGISFRPD